jgi:hypothetical protein
MMLLNQGPAALAALATGAADRAGPALLEALAIARRIDDRLFISEHTVDSHVRNILAILGFGSRARIASWVASGQ